MKFLVDAQLPRQLALRLRDQGHEAIHTRDLPLGNRTSDSIVNAISLRDSYIVITKDSDFVTTFWLKREPFKLLLISTGNITNEMLLQLLKNHLPAIVEGFEEFDFLELDRFNLYLHS